MNNKKAYILIIKAAGMFVVAVCFFLRYIHFHEKTALKVAVFGAAIAVFAWLFDRPRPIDRGR